jgi:DNA uptake protein ComE-like DNA-binding protein
MENTRLNWREAFTFTRSELRGFRLLTGLLTLIVMGRVVYFRCVPPPAIAFSIPAERIDTASNFMEQKSLGTNRNYGSKTNSWSDTIEPGTYGAVFKRSRMVELNTADTLDLRALPAIGPYLARKIVEYREKLGGFYSADQLLEVYRLTPGKLDTIRPYLVIDTTMVKRFDINSVTLDGLMVHPYLSRSQARGLIAYREKHGAFQHVVDLKKCLLIDENTFEKLSDYVEVR